MFGMIAASIFHSFPSFFSSIAVEFIFIFGLISGVGDFWRHNETFRRLNTSERKLDLKVVTSAQDLSDRGPCCVIDGEFDAV